jgi:hypothetical protein
VVDSTPAVLRGRYRPGLFQPSQTLAALELQTKLTADAQLALTGATCPNGSLVTSCQPGPSPSAISP